MSETTETEATDAVEEAPVAEAAPVEEAVETTEETPADAPAADEAPEAEAVVEDVVEEGAPAAESAVAAGGPTGPRAREGLATLYLCERGHRTLAIWSEAPQTCHARPTRAGGECGRPVYHSTELPEQVQKALNPIKASKKSSKG